MLALFGFFASASLGAPWYAFIIGFLCLGLGTDALALFGFFLCVAMHAHFIVFVIGFLCLIVDQASKKQAVIH